MNMHMQPYPLWIQLDGLKEASLVIGWSVDENGDMRPICTLDADGSTVLYRVAPDEHWTLICTETP